MKMLPCSAVQKRIKFAYHYCKENRFGSVSKTSNVLRHEPLALEGIVVQKISEHHFFQDIKNSFHGVTQICLKPHQNFFQVWSLEELKVFAY